MLRRILIASAAAAMLLVTFTPDDADARGRGGGGYRGGGGGYRGGAVAVRGAREAALSQCVAGATAIGVGPIAATAAIAATVSVRPRWAPLRSEPLRPGPTAAAATTPTATTFAPAGTVRTERRDAIDLCRSAGRARRTSARNCCQASQELNQFLGVLSFWSRPILRDTSLAISASPKRRTDGWWYASN